jgi:uncharacterized repeat protein (TIGR01451 family)
MFGQYKCKNHGSLKSHFSIRSYLYHKQKTMRRFTGAVTLLLIGFNAYPQGQQKPIIEWIRTWEDGNQGQTIIDDIAVDSYGESYLICHYANQFFDVQGTNSIQDYYLGNFDMYGAFRWGVNVSSLGFPRRVEVLNDTSLYVMGEDEIVKYDMSGNLVNSNSIPSTWNMEDFDFDSEGNVYCIGRSSGGNPVQFGDTTIGGPGLVLLKFDSNLNPVWGRKSVDGGNMYHSQIGISIDDSDVLNLVWVSLPSSNSGLNFLGSGVNTLLANPMVIAKVDVDANLIGIRGVPSNNNHFNLGMGSGDRAKVVTDESGGFYVHGNITQNTFATIDGQTIGYNNTAFVLRYGNDLQLDWYVSVRGNSTDVSGDDLLYYNGLVMISGGLYNLTGNPSDPNVSIDFNGSTYQTHGGFYFAGLDTADGSVNWLKTANAGDTVFMSDYLDIEVDANGAIYFGGRSYYSQFNLSSLLIDGLGFNNATSSKHLIGKFSLMNSRIYGKVYQDYDLDHELDAGEPRLDGQIIQLTGADGTAKYRTTTVNGEYYFAIEDSGTYVVSYNPPSNFIETGGVTSVVLVGLNDTLVSDVNFGVGYTDTIVDIQADITAFAETTFGSAFNTWTSAINTGNVTTNYSTVVSTDGLTTVTGFNQVDTVLQPGQVLTDIISLSNGTDNATATVSTTVISNTDLGSEIATNDNQDSVDVVINIPPTPVTPCCPYDPNDKTVFGAYCEANYVEIGDTLEYRIRFMNTGTAPANTVILIDTLDASVLDLRTFRVIGHSHPMYWDISGPGKLTITYPDINLPDSSVSFLGSQGFFKFRIVMRDTVSNLTQSGSSAFIYFDNEAPIETNEPTIIAVDSIPVSELTATDAICGGESGLIDASISFGIGADSAYWGNGSTGLPLLFNDEGTYTVELVDEYGCRYLDSIAVSCNILTSVDENGETFSVYPNPSNGKYYVNAKGIVRVFDVSGKEVYRTSSFNAPTEVDLSALPSGVYTMQLTNKGGAFVGKVVKE